MKNLHIIKKIELKLAESVMTVGEEEAPQRGLQHSVEPLVKRPGGEVAAPVVVVTVGVREEVAAKRRQRRPRC